MCLPKLSWESTYVLMRNLNEVNFAITLLPSTFLMVTVNTFAPARHIFIQVISHFITAGIFFIAHQGVFPYFNFTRISILYTRKKRYFLKFYVVICCAHFTLSLGRIGPISLLSRNRSPLTISRNNILSPLKLFQIS